MLKATALYPVVLTVMLSVFSGIVQAQQRNRPAAVTVPTATVKPVPAAYSNGTNVNYIRTWDAIAPITDPNSMVTAGYQNAIQKTQYVDGLGRPLQTVTRQITPETQPRDLVAPVVYDAFGRVSDAYLPYVAPASNGLFRMDPFNEQKSFMQTKYPDEQVYYSQTVLEASPLKRPVKTMSPGNSWGGSNRGISMNYQVYNTPDVVRVWNITNNALTYSSNDINTNIPVSPKPYNAGELYKKITKDENENAVVEYTDKSGQVICKKVQVATIPTDFSGHDGFLCTYYVYDDLGLLRFVIPPKAVALLPGAGWALTTDMINELCYRYEYDGRNRMIAKKIPGAGWTYMIYDKRDRLVFMQDANMRGRNQWMATLYDDLNRVVMTGMMTYSGSPLTLQTEVTTPGSTTPSGVLSDLVLPTSQIPSPISGTYQAYNSITLDNGFESLTGADFTAEVYGGAQGTGQVDGMVINENPIPFGATFTALTKNYYDDYDDLTNVAYSAAYNNNLDAGSNLHPVNMPSQAQQQPKGQITGTRVRAIEDVNNLAVGRWLTTVKFYDDRGRIIQVNSENYRNGHDITTLRYDFTGKPICSYLDHTNPTGTPASLHVKTNMEYDYAGRLQELWKTINDDNSKKAVIVRNEYDELGQLKNKQLGHKKVLSGSYTGTSVDPIETLNYSYNILGWVTGINKDYANNTGSSGSWFGLELSYDKGFEKTQFNGNIAGTKWRSKGDGAQRAYGFTYDNSNRLLGADFTQFDGSAYNDNSIVQFDMVMGNGVDTYSAYDENGNIKAMKQWGLKLNSSQIIDDLRYTYYDNSNKLKNVVDFNNDELTKLADFRTSANHPQKTQKASYAANQGSVNINSITDYTYDDNGNLKKDLNKDIGTAANEDIIYNHLNLPQVITVRNAGGAIKGTIKYLYDAAGSKLQKITTELNVSVQYNNSNYSSTVTTTTSYIGGVMYESKSYDKNVLASLAYSDRLQAMGQEEGRIRYIPASGTAAAHFEYDYFVKDQLGNVRMVLTEEQKQDIYPAATLENVTYNNGTAISVEDDFYNIDASKVVDQAAASGIPVYPNNNGIYNNNFYSNTSANSTRLYKLNASGNTPADKTGLGIVLKVMAGDAINIFGKSYHKMPVAGYSSPVNGVIVSELINGFAGSSLISAKGVTGSQITGQPGFPSSLNQLIGNQPDQSADRPKAAINWIILDEQFKWVGGGFDMVGAAVNPDGTFKTHDNSTIPTINIPKNGYIYVFCSNESQYNVFFDNLQVIHTKGALLEETHYYPFGLAMTGISSKTMGVLDNKFDYNGKEKQDGEFSDGSGLEWHDYGARMYDAQIGRWHVQDAMTEKMRRHSPYNYCINNPLKFTDPDGMMISESEMQYLRSTGDLVNIYTNGDEQAGSLPNTHTTGNTSVKQVEVNGKSYTEITYNQEELQGVDFEEWGGGGYAGIKKDDYWTYSNVQVKVLIDGDGDIKSASITYYASEHNNYETHEPKKVLKNINDQNATVTQDGSSFKVSSKLGVSLTMSGSTHPAQAISGVMAFNAKYDTDFPKALAEGYLDSESKMKDVLGLLGIMGKLLGKMEGPLTVAEWFAPGAAEIATQPFILSSQKWINLNGHPPFYIGHYFGGYETVNIK